MDGIIVISAMIKVCNHYPFFLLFSLACQKHACLYDSISFFNIIIIFVIDNIIFKLKVFYSEWLVLTATFILQPSCTCTTYRHCSGTRKILCLTQLYVAFQKWQFWIRSLKNNNISYQVRENNRLVWWRNVRNLIKKAFTILYYDDKQFVFYVYFTF